MILGPSDNRVTIRHAHMACGIGAGAKGFNQANPRVGNLVGKFQCVGGIDVDAGAIANFEMMTGVPGTVMDLFNLEQYLAFHGKAPPPGWREANPDDIRRTFGDKVDILFASYPCKGFSGLLSQEKSLTDKYQALNALTLRGQMLTLEAYKDDPIPLIIFENVPRIQTRGRWLIDQIIALYHGYGYHVAESVHDCGEVAPGGLAQSRNRFLLVARHPSKVPDVAYEPVKSPLRGVGEVIGHLPLPGDPAGGPMHRIPELQWRTWVRLAFVPAGRDWRALNELAVENGHLRDYGIIPKAGHNDAYGVCRWSDTAPVVTSARAPGQGRFSVADPRHFGPVWRAGCMGVRDWSDTSGVVAARNSPTNGAFSVADPRPTQANQSFKQYGVMSWSATTGVVSGQMQPGGGAHCIADPRLGRVAYSNIYRVIGFDTASISVTSSREICVADPRPAESAYSSRKYKVTPFDASSRAVIGASTTGDGAFAVADPRLNWAAGAHSSKFRVVPFIKPAPVVATSDRVGSGAMCVADPRSGISRDRVSYLTQGHYGVAKWAEHSRAVPGFAKYDRGAWSIADPRFWGLQHQNPVSRPLPQPGDRLVARIVAEDGTWHRPFTTLELAALQSLFDPAESFALVGRSDAVMREWIGNAVPSAAARGMAEALGEALLRAKLGITFSLSSRSVWVSPLEMALAVKSHQPARQMDAGLI